MGWIGVDLDGTLAEYRPGQGSRIGKPIKAMVNRINNWVSEGQEVRIFTARAATRYGASEVVSWLEDHNLPALTVTNAKDSELTQIWDDKAIRVTKNTGKVCSGCGKGHSLTSECDDIFTDC
ncbi:hypothetical protein PTR77_08535 [Serratia bockelmannii]|uniref:hypothetical protein n=1 Tax=Serratia bockelmannii TaxID=2703793 RepID=UPI00313B668D